MSEPRRCRVARRGTSPRMPLLTLSSPPLSSFRACPCRRGSEITRTGLPETALREDQDVQAIGDFKPIGETAEGICHVVEGPTQGRHGDQTVPGCLQIDRVSLLVCHENNTR